jgi:hypothetical protein
MKPPGLDLHRRAHLPLSGPMERYLPMLALTAVPSLRPLASSRTQEPHQLGKYLVSSAPLVYQNT